MDASTKVLNQQEPTESEHHLRVLCLLNVGHFNGEKRKHGYGAYTWKEADEEGGFKKVASYEGLYEDGKKCGLGKMTFPNGDVYHGEWKDNKVRLFHPDDILRCPKRLTSRTVCRLRARARTRTRRRRTCTAGRGRAG